MQSRWKSPVLWTSIFAQVVVILKLTGVLEKIGIEESLLTNIAAAILQALVLFGVLNNPTNPEGF
jgi:uncharacterized membrane protein